YIPEIKKKDSWTNIVFIVQVVVLVFVVMGTSLDDFVRTVGMDY
ncbi:unnamed protein product, partial [marine sediment metagenome]